ncbi:glucose 1-dehydrogenase [Vibrio owensii]|uniref:2,5-dichloro-2,5-cyclohexadiene-1,4-diol dehydrogenase n=2 Tax=Vibrio harveyi group TaxID=717610 RepID=A0A510ICE8_9VIBR|nr:MULTISPECIES: glucose 1-dehydrogenase [Vibrio harveyi group]NOJ18508.1 glucose 1-dehydrogenase [Vibrio jasicida]TMX61706.1 short-chain dehydrogenase [Vibrio rotiferianus]BBL91464.1 2,5-dichloro-2,5-cyclohexadiene-1,4-diol dehydrogenase [Vibrio rotiferianus]CAH1538203.1 2,5-dichloro-2,5-cyclohexadiene-1,4-diol dehydrogenase [Vibrio owensii]
MKMLNDKVAVVTGAGSGIGRSIAIDYAQQGAKVVVSDINEQGGMDTVKAILAVGGTACFQYANVAKLEDNLALVERAVVEYGRLDIACNNAGVSHDLHQTGDISVDSWQFVMDVNLTGVFYGMKTQIEQMRKNGGGSIVNIGSVLSQRGFQGAGAYVAAKHAVVGLTKNAALDHAAENIRVNCVAPAYVNTPLVTAALNDEQVEGLKALHAMGRLGEEQEIANLVSFVSSDKASFVTGEYYAADGGYLIR